MSSTTATPVRNTRSGSGTRRPSARRQPSAKAMSVAIGTAHPRCSSGSGTRARNTSAGTTIPPSAAPAGTSAWRTDRSSPDTISRFSSRPTTRKKIAIRKSLIQRISGLLSAKPPAPAVNECCRIRPYPGERLAQASAITVAARSTIPEAVSSRKNASSGESSSRCGSGASPVDMDRIMAPRAGATRRRARQGRAA